MQTKKQKHDELNQVESKSHKVNSRASSLRGALCSDILRQVSERVAFEKNWGKSPNEAVGQISGCELVWSFQRLPEEQ